MIIAISGKIGSGKDTVTKIIQWLTLQNDYPNVWNNKEHNLDFFLDYGIDKSHTWQSNWENRKFAGKLKQIVGIITGIPVEDLEREEVKNSYLGEEWNRLYWKDPDAILGNDYRIEKIHYYEGGETAFITYNSGLSEANIFLYELVTERMTVRQLLQEMGTDAMRNVIHPNIHVNALFEDYKVLTGGIIDEHDNIYPNWIISDMRFPNELEAVKKHGGITIRINRDKCVMCQRGKPCAWLTCPNKEEKSQHLSETALDNATFDYVINNFGTMEDLIEEVREILIKENIINGNK